MVIGGYGSNADTVDSDREKSYRCKHPRCLAASLRPISYRIGFFECLSCGRTYQL